MDKNAIIYSDEHETRIVRVKDVIPAIEGRIGLPVIEVQGGSREDVDSPITAEQFPTQKPTALWWFLVTFESPEGKRTGMVKVALVEQEISVVQFGRPTLLFYNEALRRRAREEAKTGLAQEYIGQLEEALKHARDLWKIANTYAEAIPDLRDDLYQFYTEFRKVGHLLRDANDGGPQGLGRRKLYLPSWMAKTPDQYITGDEELL